MSASQKCDSLFTYVRLSSLLLLQPMHRKLALKTLKYITNAPTCLGFD